MSDTFVPQSADFSDSAAFRGTLMGIFILKTATTLTGALAALALGTVGASATTIDFGSYASGTPLASADGVTFSLIGGPGTDGTPLIGIAAFPPIGLTDSDTSGTYNFYPTATILNFAFSSPASGVSFYYNSEGDDGNFYEAFSGSTLVSTGSIGFDDGTTDIIVPGSGITDIQFNNNSGGAYSFVSYVNSITFTSGVPEPAAWTLMLIGLGAAGATLRSSRRQRAAA